MTGFVEKSNKHLDAIKPMNLCIENLKDSAEGV
jgi:hypothetical protein